MSDGHGLDRAVRSISPAPPIWRPLSNNWPSATALKEARTQAAAPATGSSILPLSGTAPLDRSDASCAVFRAGILVVATDLPIAPRTARVGAVTIARKYLPPNWQRGHLSVTALSGPSHKACCDSQCGNPFDSGHYFGSFLVKWLKSGPTLVPLRALVAALATQSNSKMAADNPLRSCTCHLRYHGLRVEGGPPPSRPALPPRQLPALGQVYTVL